MAETKIEWADFTFNPWRGCSKVSPGCANCYAETLSKRNPKVLGEWGPNGKRVIAAESYWRLPLAWDRAAAAAGERRRVFCASLADVFEDRQSLVEPRTRLYRLIHQTPNLDWLLLTKRPQNVAGLNARFACEVDTYEAEAFSKVWMRRIWLGVSVEDQARADERVPLLLQTPAAVRFLSIEPLLGQVNLHGRLGPAVFSGTKCWDRGIDWVIAGGESGPSARPMHPDWPKSLRDQCLAAGVPFFFKQWGEWAPIAYGTPDGKQLLKVTCNGKTEIIVGDGADSINMRRVGKKAAGRRLDGREWNEFPK